MTHVVSEECEVIWSRITAHKLEPFVAELDVRGYTVIPPEIVAPQGFADELRQAILRVIAKRTGVEPDIAHGTEYEDPSVPFGVNVAYLLFENPVFQKAAVNPVVLTLVDYLLGRSSVLSNCIAFMKGPRGSELELHSDNVHVPAPFAPQAQVCNATWLLTDYTREGGALCFVPGSHTLGRHPEPGEALSERVAVEAPAGSVAFWHGNTWHGAFKREIPGARINLINAFMRLHMRPQEPYRENVTDEILDANPPEFARLMGTHLDYGWKEEGPQYKDRTNAEARTGNGHYRWD